MPTTSDQDVLLPGIGMGGYRSLRELQALGPLQKVTLIAGQNNAGKSNILRFASSLLAHPVPPFAWADKPQPGGPPLRLQIAYWPLGAETLEQYAGRFAHPDQLTSLFAHEVFHPVEGGHIWLTYSCDEAPSPSSLPGRRAWTLDEKFLSEAVDHLGADGQRLLGEASSALTSLSGGRKTDDIRRVLEELFPFRSLHVVSVGAFRQIAPAADSNTALSSPLEGIHSGLDLVRRLAQLASPPAERFVVDRAKFDAINKFAQTVLEDRHVQIRISADQSEIQVDQGGRVLPLPNLGTGIHQVIILAAAATLLEHALVCIEEPEVHLHPLLQRKLVRYLSEATTNQYLIATHSAHMLDYERACVLHVRFEAEKGTLATRATSVQAISNLCGDLGYRPSDLIQSNAVIWVEGPSDRIYLNYWLRMLVPNEFVEGIHYSVMFYGGGLLRHLTADDPSVEEFISLRRLNRHSAILIDSDKTSARGGLSATKIRVREEFGREDMPGLAWITDCRTIENYVPTDALAAAVSAVHPRSSYDPPAEKWEDPLVLWRGAQIMGRSRGSMGSRKPGEEPQKHRVQPDKVRIARAVLERWPAGELSSHLRSQVGALVSFIRVANGSGDPLPQQPTR